MENFDFEFDVGHEQKQRVIMREDPDNELFSSSALVYSQCSRQGNLQIYPYPCLQFISSFSLLKHQ